MVHISFHAAGVEIKRLGSSRDFFTPEQEPRQQSWQAGLSLLFAETQP